MSILNLTQHPATEDQTKDGVFEPSDKRRVKDLLTFVELPSQAKIAARATILGEIAKESGADAAMIGGAPYLMRPLEKSLLAWGIKPLYSFSRRESVEKIAADGTVTKTNVFKHVGFVRK